METIFNYISSHFLETLIVILLCLLFIREAFVGWINTALGRPESDVARKTAKMANDMTALRMHFNDETTHILTELQTTQAEMLEMLRNGESTAARQCGKLEEICDTLRDMSRNGIRIRK